MSRLFSVKALIGEIQCRFSRRGENRSTRGKTSRAKKRTNKLNPHVGWVWESNVGRIGERRVLSPLRYYCSQKFVDLVSLNDLPNGRKLKFWFCFLYFAGNWSKIARAVGNRTDNQCWRRWIVLCKDDVSFILFFYITEIRRRNTRTMTSCVTPQLS